MIKFMKFYVTDGAVKAKVFYSLDNRADSRKCVTIYAKGYDDGDVLGRLLPDGYINNTDIMTDYFERGRAVLFEGHEHYEAARVRAMKYE